MQSRAKIFGFAAIALIAAATGAYVLAPTADRGPAETQSEIASSDIGEKLSEMASSNTAAVQPNVNDAVSAPAAKVVDQLPAVPTGSSPGQPSGKLTQEQLTPPAPKTEDEKLQKAAEQEYNRF